MADIDVSVVVPTYNEERNLGRLLESIVKQEKISYEILVVDQQSSDATQQIATSYGATIISRERPPFYSPPSQSRNVGAEIAKGSYLVHLDADMELPDPEFLLRFVRLFDEAHQAAVIHEQDIAQGWWNRVKATERSCYWDSEMEYARGVTRSLFLKVGGYDPAISSGEDASIHQSYSAHTQIARSSDVWLCHHTGRISLRRLLTKKFSYGRTAASYLEHVKHTSGNDAQGDLIKAALRAYGRNAVRMLRNRPLQFLCVFPLRVAELVAVRLGMRSASKVMLETPSKTQVAPK